MRKIVGVNIEMIGGCGNMAMKNRFAAAQGYHPAVSYYALSGLREENSCRCRGAALFVIV